MLTVPCPSCYRSLAVREEVAGNEFRCVCGHCFIPAQIPPDPLQMPGADRPQAAPTKGPSIWSRPLFQSPASRPASIPTNGPVKCPYCSVVVVDDALWLGQTINCPNCHASFKAPDAQAQVKRTAIRERWLIYAFGAAILAAALADLASGQFAGPTFGTIAAAVVILIWQHNATLRRIPMKLLVVMGSLLLVFNVIDAYTGFRHVKNEPVPLGQLYDDLDKATARMRSLQARKVDEPWNFNKERELVHWQVEVQSLRNQIKEREH